MRLLLAEDDEYLVEALCLGLSSKGYNVDFVKSGTGVLEALAGAAYDLVILDLGLPLKSGSEVLKDLRLEGNPIPVIIITARDAVADRITGLDLGANDYLTKPFDFGELEARIRALLRKNVWNNQLEIVLGSIKYTINSREISLDNEPVDFTQREVAILDLLLRRAGKLVTKRQLVDHVSTWENEPSENAIEIVIHRIRRKLEATTVKIRTVHGFGYILEEAE